MTTNFSHANCTHPRTPAARSACRKAQGRTNTPTPRVDVPVDLLATATLPVNDHLTTGDHMGMNDAARITRDMIAQHGLTGWNVTFDNQRRRAGACVYSRRLISLSRPLMQQRSFADTHSTITHEIAHALTPGHNHDQVWAAKHIELGGNGKRCFEHEDLSAPWIGTCAHGKVWPKYRAPKRPEAQFTCRCVRGDKRPFTFVPNPNA